MCVFNDKILKLQKSLTAMEHVRLERSAEGEQNLLYDQSDIRTELKELKRLSTIKVNTIFFSFFDRMFKTLSYKEIEFGI